jgi:hypothetical protein
MYEILKMKSFHYRNPNNFQVQKTAKIAIFDDFPLIFDGFHQLKLILATKN